MLPKLGPMMHEPKVRNLMSNDIINHNTFKVYQAPIKVYAFFAAAGAPAGFRIGQTPAMQVAAAALQKNMKSLIKPYAGLGFQPRLYQRGASGQGGLLFAGDHQGVARCRGEELSEKLGACACRLGDYLNVYAQVRQLPMGFPLLPRLFLCNIALLLPR